MNPLTRSALPLIALWAAMPLWWALGLQKAIGVVLAIPLLVWLLLRRSRVEVPVPLLLLLGFIGWVLISALGLTQPHYGMAWLMRLSFYVTALVIGLYAWNALRQGLSPRPLIWAIVAMWAAAVLLAFPGLRVAGLGWTSLAEYFLQAAGVNHPFLIDITHPQLSEWDAVYDVARPSPLFAYTNEWGAAMGLLTPIAVYAAVTTRSPALRWGTWAMIALSAYPILVSVNRGCWISIALATAYVVLRRSLAGDPRAAVGLALASVVGFVVIMGTPVADLLRSRFEYSNTSTRSTLYQASVEMALRSPLVGYGSPQSSAGIPDSNDVSIGTHGQLWTLLVSQGFVGTVLFVSMLVALFWFSRPLSGRAPEVWLHSVGVVVLAQLAFYETVPDGLILAFAACFICAVVAGRYSPEHASDAPDLTPKMTTREGTLHEFARP